LVQKGASATFFLTAGGNSSGRCNISAHVLITPVLLIVVDLIVAIILLLLLLVALLVLVYDYKLPLKFTPLVNLRI
jgi:hypothetical protein